MIAVRSLVSPIWITLEEIISRSGDFQLLGYSFDNDVLEVRLEHDELDQVLTLRIPTDVVYRETLSKNNDIFLSDKRR